MPVETGKQFHDQASPPDASRETADTPDKDAQKTLDEQEKARAEASVKRWTSRIRNAKEHWKDTFKEMRDNMDFAAGIQWRGQDKVQTSKYVANLVNRAINQKVSTLYARNPEAEYQRRKRLDYQLWDGRLESLVQSMQSLAMNPFDAQSKAVLTDYMNGHQKKQLIDKVGRTLEIVYKYQLDEQEPNFKSCMKRLVRRVATCGVGYVRMSYKREDTAALTSSGKQSSLHDRIQKTKHLAEKYDKGDIDKESATSFQLGQLFSSVQYSVSDPVEQQDVKEGLVLDFPSSTSIIVDTRCRSIRDFDGCHWAAEEMLLPLDIVNAFFETDIKAGGELKHYSQHGAEKAKTGSNPSDKDPDDGPFVCLWHVWDQDTKSQFFIVDGFKEYVQVPEPATPEIRRFWPVFTLTFNDVETDPQCKATCFPPSDVQLMKSPQREWNRTRDELKKHRISSPAIRMTGKGWLTAEDKNKINDAETGDIIELEGVGSASSGIDINKLLAAFPPCQLNPEVYDTAPMEQDLLMVIGQLQENLGPVSNKGTATQATIAEQSRNATSGSNVDDLDDLLSDLARSGGEMLLREMSPESVQRIAGVGAAWPTVDREDFLDEIYLEAIAASSGRPNKAVEIANFERLVPFLLQAGAKPDFIVMEGIKRLDDRLDPEDAFPLMPMQQNAAPPQPKGGSPNGTGNQPTPAGPQQPPQQLPSQAPVPLAAG